MTGFGVFVSSPKTRTYFVQCRVKDRCLPNGKPIEIYESIGRTDRVDFETAFNLAKGILDNAALGIAPEDIRLQKANLEAEKIAARIEEQKKDVTLGEMFKDYIMTRRDRKKLKESTIELYEEDFERYIPGWMEMPLRLIDGTMIVHKHAEIGKLSPARADGVMRVLRAVCNHTLTMKPGVLASNPVTMLTAMNGWFNVGRKRTYIRPEQLKVWLSAVLNLGYDTSQDFILMLLFQGTRLQETARLRWKDINLDRGYAIFRETKSSEPLEVPLSRFMLDRLTKRKKFYYQGPDSYIYPSHAKSGHVEGALGALDTVSDACGVTATHHDLRRSFISYCEELDIPLFTRKRLVNHALPQDVTEGYTMFNLEKLRVHIERIAAFILGHAGIAYKSVETPPLTDDQAAMIAQSAFWNLLSDDQKEEFLKVLLPQKETAPAVIDLENKKIRRRLGVK